MSSVEVPLLGGGITAVRQRNPRIFYAGIASLILIVFILAQPIPLPENLKLADLYHKTRPSSVAFAPANLDASVQRSEELWARNRQKRLDYVKEKNGGTWEGFKMFHTKGAAGEVLRYTLWDIFPPAFPCMWELERIGRIVDGGKWVCGLPRLAETRGKNLTVYSFGVERESSFEAELLERTDAEIFMYDFSVNTFGPQIEAMNETMQSRAHFFPYGLGAFEWVDDKNNRFYSLKDLMTRNGHDWIDILKIDIEGQEFKVLPQIIQEFGNGNLPFGQLLLEIHADHTEHAYHTPEFAAWWDQLEAAGLRASMNELNYPSIFWLPYPTAIEYTMINNCLGRKDCGTLVRDV